MSNEVLSKLNSVDAEIKAEYLATDTKNNTPLDTSLKFAPFAILFALDANHTKTKNSFTQQVQFILTAELILNVAVLPLKYFVRRKRPNGKFNSFPSGHTATCF